MMQRQYLHRFGRPAPGKGLPNRSSRRLVGLLAAALLLSACAGLPPPTSHRASLQQAVSAARAGLYALSAQRYEQLAAFAPAGQKAPLQLAAAREWLAAGEPSEAARVLSAVHGPLNASVDGERRELLAETLLRTGKPQQAWRQISAAAVPDNAAQAQAFLALRMRAAFAAGRPIDGIRAEMADEDFASGPAARTKLREGLLAALERSRMQGIRLDLQASSDPIVRGWLALAQIAGTASPALGRVALEAQWRAQYPDHPATELLAQAFPALPNMAGDHVALLLPLTGPDAGLATTVRDGFLSAYFELPATSRPDLHFYDTGSMGAAEALARARADGATFVVGPLTRPAVEALVALGPQPVPVLALNFLPDGKAGPSGFYQFALSPVDEARMVADRVIADGRMRGVALVPRDEWGARVLDAFTRELALRGGQLLASATYGSDENDYGAQIKSMLRIDQSEARRRRLETVLHVALQFDPRRRADIDFVFAPARTSTDERLVRAQLRYFYGGGIPVYALPDAYQPGDAGSGLDLDGLMYPDMPWLIDGEPGLTALQALLGAAWGNQAAWRTRLFAFGYDACQLQLAMQSAADPGSVHVLGLTGQLHFNAARRVQRGLTWVQIRDGQPEPISAAALE